MGCISASGTASAAPTTGWGRLIRPLLLAPLALAGLTGTASPVNGSLDVAFDGLRNQRGLVRICITRNPANFLRCHNDPQSRRVNLPADRVGSVRLDGLSEGNYAIAVIHDENRNGHLDTFLGIPREGFGFSRNPRIGFGPPSFDQVRFELGAGGGVQRVRIRYIV